MMGIPRKNKGLTINIPEENSSKKIVSYDKTGKQLKSSSNLF